MISAKTYASELVKKTLHGHLKGGAPVHLFRLGREDGPSVTISEQGCTLTEILMPDRNGELGNIILSHPTLDGYMLDQDYLGAVVGRVANRISNASFTLDERRVSLTANIPPHHLHGGVKGFNRFYWAGEIVTADEPTVRFRRVSPDGEEGYPGMLEVTVEYTLTEEQNLDVRIHAETTESTVVNMTLHPYFNLAANGAPVLDQELQIHGDAFLPMSPESLTTGEVRKVEGTPMDFRTPHAIGSRIEEEDEQLAAGSGYDHCWVLNGERGSMNLAAQAYDPASGRTLELFTSETGVQLYTGNMLGDWARASGVEGFPRRTAFCLEPQNWPDAPNKPNFPSSRLDPGETYIHQIRYSFGWR